MAKRGKVSSEENIQRRHTARQKKRRRAMRIRRTIFFLILLCIALGIVMFMTPVFNIQAVKIAGNEKVATEEISTVTNSIIGQNLFKTNLSQLQSLLSSIPYLDEIQIKRTIYPPSLKINVTESKPSAYVNTGDGYALIDRNCKLLEISTQQGVNIPEILGLNASKYTPGAKLSIDESQKFDIILLCINEFNSAGITGSVRTISVADITNITFEYDGRLDVICGSLNDLSKKISLFKEVIMSNRLPANSRGTVDLSTAGKAIYTP